MGGDAATLTAYGLAGLNLHTWTGWGSVTYWNAFVANLEMTAVSFRLQHDAFVALPSGHVLPIQKLQQWNRILP